MAIKHIGMDVQNYHKVFWSTFIQGLVNEFGVSIPVSGDNTMASFLHIDVGQM